MRRLERMANNIKFIEDMVMVILRHNIGSANPVEEDIRNAISKAELLNPMTDTEKKLVEKSIQSKLKVKMDLGTQIVDPASYHPWLASRRAFIDPYYWNRYRDYLLLEKGWNEQVVDKLGDVSDEILDLVGNPEENRGGKRKGLILGDIQSGKTSNYIALCNKAADAGYKVIILLTGTIESLRKQTQERIDAGFVGLNSRNVLQRKQEKKYIGVGLQDNRRTAYPFTDIISDFNSTKLQSLNFTVKGLSEPVVLVIKKNKSVLKNLESWLRTCNTDVGTDKIDLPLLLIDDEADNASVNTKKEDENPTAINEGIKKILKLFSCSSYVAVTATPFANIFIDPDNDVDVYNSDLFPTDFIYALSAPTNYIGSMEIFGEEAPHESSLVTIDDVDGHFRSKAKSAHIVPELPLSLQEAVVYFLICNVIQDLDGNQNSHRSMLVNVSQFVNVQDQVYDMIVDLVKKYRQHIKNYSKLEFDIAFKNSTISFFYSIWNKYKLETVTAYKWFDIQNSLYESIMPIEIRLVNQRAKAKGIERLDYEPYNEIGLRVIAIGGNSLSRGLTLEGLCVSYFDRNSQMYDTLMQMGRWFGYRDGYEEIFKIWMEADAISWYQYISGAVDELREEIEQMRRSGLTPKDFGLKVRQDITALFVTARNKMRSTTIVERWINVAAEVIETPKLVARKESLIANIKATNDFLKTILNKKLESDIDYGENKKVYSGIDKEIIADYIKNFISHPRHIPFSPKDLSQYIRSSTQFTEWDIAIIGGAGEKINCSNYFDNQIINLNIKFAKRVIKINDNCLLISGQRARVGIPGATKYGLEKEQIQEIEVNYHEDNPTVKTIPDKPYLTIDRNPILLIYIMEIDTEKLPVSKRKINSDDEAINLVKDIPIIGLGLGFPGNGESEKVRYVINKIEERNQLNFEEDDEFDED